MGSDFWYAKAAQYLEEEFPDVAEYLESLPSPNSRTAPTTSIPTASPQTPSLNNPSQHAQNEASEQLTSSLMQSVQDIMMRAEADGHDPEAELRQVVERTVLEGVMTGYDLSSAATDRREREDRELNGAKRSRTDDGPDAS